MVVNESNLRGSNAGILEFEGGALLATEDDDVLAFDTDGAGPCRSSTISNPFDTGSDRPMNGSILRAVNVWFGWMGSHLASRPPWHIRPGRRAHRDWGWVRRYSLELKLDLDDSYLNTGMS